MSSLLLRRCNRCGGDAGVPYRRTQPEIILPILAPAPAGVGTPPAAAWTYGAWGTLVTAAQFASAYRIVGIQPSFSARDQLVATNATVGIPRVQQWQIGEQLAGVDTPICKVSSAMGLRHITSGQVAGSASTAIALLSGRLHCYPFERPAGTLLRCRVAKSDAFGATAQDTYTIAVPAGGYDYATLDPARLVEGGDATLPDLADAALTAGAGAWVPGAWTNVFTAAQNYLATCATLFPDDPTDYQVEIEVQGVGTQAWLGLANIAGSGVADVPQFTRFEDLQETPPFQVLSGETVRARAHSLAGASDVIHLNLELTPYV
jgi:hypothetical protein